MLLSGQPIEDYEVATKYGELRRQRVNTGWDIWDCSRGRFTTRDKLWVLCLSARQLQGWS